MTLQRADVVYTLCLLAGEQAVPETRAMTDPTVGSEAQRVSKQQMLAAEARVAAAFQTAAVDAMAHMDEAPVRAFLEQHRDEAMDTRLSADKKTCTLTAGDASLAHGNTGGGQLFALVRDILCALQMTPRARDPATPRATYTSYLDSVAKGVVADARAPGWTSAACEASLASELDTVFAIYHRLQAVGTAQPAPKRHRRR